MSAYIQGGSKISTFCSPYNLITYWPIFKLFFTVRIRRKVVI